MVHNVCSCTVMKVWIKIEGLLNRGSDALTLLLKTSLPGEINNAVRANFLLDCVKFCH